MKYRRSWLHPCRQRGAAPLTGARPGTSHRNNPNQPKPRIDEAEPSSYSRHVGLRQRGRSLCLVKSDTRRSRELHAMTATIMDLRCLSLAAGALFLAVSGCSISTTRHGWPGPYAPEGVPNAQNCVPFSFGQPTEFACKDGKIYTAQKLRELRTPKTYVSTVASTSGY
jgi:hypothetical protein